MPSETRVVIEGALDFESVPRHLPALLAATEHEAPVVHVDLSGCDFIDSNGLGALVNASRRARERGGTLYLVAPRRPVAKLIEFAALGAILPVLAVDQRHATSARAAP